MKKIIVSHRRGEICAAIVDDGELVTFRKSTEFSPQIVGNIYKGRVNNVLPGMNAAFIDIGRDKNAFLQFGASKKFSVGQNVLIQIEKDEVSSKGARATLNISLPGRFMIFLPTLNYIGVSNKIRGDERNRLHALAKKIRPANCGLIVRTVAKDCDENILLNELSQLQMLWTKILERNDKRKSPALLYSDNDLIEKILREDFTEDTDFFVDSLKIYRKLAEHIAEEKIIFFEDDSIFETFNLSRELDSINERELNLPSGGRIVIDKTEALTAVDVNTGKFIGHKNFDETILKTNLEAAEIILKQLRLRDLGGIIIVDFIDMGIDEHKKILMDFLREKARLDRNRTKIIDMTPLGLVEITRHGSNR